MCAFVGPQTAVPGPALGQTPAPPPARAFAAPEERGVERFQLDNGLKVFLRPVKGAEATFLNVVYSIGSDHDPEGQSGLTHWIEHLYLTAASGAEKARTVGELMGQDTGEVNGQTGDRYTVLATGFPAEKLEEQLKYAAARMGDLRITPADLDRERTRLLEEVGNMFGGFPFVAASNHARELVRPTPFGSARNGGSPDQIQSIKIDDIQQFYKRYYKPRNAIVALAGDFDPARARKLISTRFAAIPSGEAAPAAHEPGKPKFGTIRELSVASSVPNAEPMACIAFLAPGPGSELYAPFLVLIMRLWNGAQKLDERGAFGSPVFFTPLDDGAIVSVSFKVRPGESAAKAIGRINAFVAETIAPKLQADDIVATRNDLGPVLDFIDVPEQFLAGNPYGVAFSLARREQLGLDPARLNRALDKVTERDLRRGRRDLRPNPPCRGRYLNQEVSNDGTAENTGGWGSTSRVRLASGADLILEAT